MTLQKIKSELFESLEVYFAENDFRLIKTKNRFENTSGSFRFIYKLLFHARKKEIALELYVLVEHIETERIYKDATGHIIFETIGNEIGKLIRNPDGIMRDHHSQDLIIRKLSDVKGKVHLIKKYFEEIALPYYSKNGNLNRIDEILNNNPQEISVHANAQYFRCPKGLIVAKLNHRPNYKELEKIYDKKMESMNELSRDRYLKVKLYLDNFQNTTIC
jgi:hypothetical protein